MTDSSWSDMFFACRYRRQSSAGEENCSSANSRSIVFQECVAVRAVHEGNIERCTVIESLLHAIANAVIIVLCLDNCQRDVGLVVKDVIRALWLAACDKPASDLDPTGGEGDLLPDLRLDIPACMIDRWSHELGADVSLTEGFLIHGFLLWT